MPYNKQIFEGKYKWFIDRFIENPEEGLSVLLENLPDIVMIIDNDSKILYINHPLPNCSLGEAIGKNFLETLSPNDQKRHKQAIQRVFQKGQPDQFEHGANDSNWWFNRVFPIKQAEDTIVAMMISRNITEHRKAEDELKKTRQELQIIFDSVPAMIFYKDKENKFIRINKFLADMSGKPKSEIEGASAFAVFPEHAEEYWKDDKEVMGSGKAKLNIIEPLETKEETKWVQTHKIPYRNEEGEIIGIIGFSADITALKKTEDDLKRKIGILEEFKRTTEDKEIKLIEMQARVKELEKEIASLKVKS